MYADIALIRNDKDTDKLYTYEISKSLQDDIKSGSKVSVSFGKGKNFIMGFVFQIHNDVPDFKTKIINEVFSPIYALNIKQIALCNWMRNKYICTYSQAIKTILPQEFIRGSKPSFRIMIKISPLLDSAEAIDKAIRPNATKQRKALLYLLKNESLDETLFIKEAGVSRALITSMEKKNLISINRTSYKVSASVNNTQNQIKHVPNQILCMLDNSDRENCYLHYIDEAVKGNECILVISNEVSEAKGLFNLFSKRYSHINIVLYNGNLSASSLESIHDSILTKKANLVFGTRNSLFLPFNKLGLIIVDHESEYGHKSDTMPKFHTSEVAEFLSDSYNARLIYSDISPTIRSYYENVKSKALLIGKDIVIGNSNKTFCVDMKLELRHGNKTMFSMLLDEKIRNTYKKGQGTILLLNQKGHSSSVACRSCGYVRKCPLCGLSLTYYAEDNLLRCPHCAYSASADSVCPDCGSHYYRYLGIGPEKVKTEIANRLPGANVFFLSNKSIKTYSALESSINKFNSGEHDIIIATELILKNKLIKRPVLFSILNADMFLYGQDFHANERFFSLVRRIRSSIGFNQNELLIQTYNPEQMAIRHILENNYESFYKEELLYRNTLKLPPYYRMAIFHIFGDEEASVVNMANDYGIALKKAVSNHNIKILGPSKNDNLRYKSRYKYQLVARYSQVDINKFMGIIKYVNKNKRQAFRKSAVKISFDFDARCL
ncbi:MAG: primosomal protein N' [Peptostreptococcaceae bacterium]|nr:primosomal protein N' [Peptostreptococcaceae bacterium]